MSYPYVESMGALAESISPSIAVRDDGAAYVTASVSELGPINDDVGRIYDGLVDLFNATGPVLDICGDLVSEPRGGMRDDSYQRIIQGRRVASEGGGAVTHPRVYQGWTSMLSPYTTARMTTPDDDAELGTAGVTLSASILWTPTSLWLARAGQVVSDLMGAGYDVTATVATPGSCLYGQAYGRPYSYSLRTS